MMQYDPENGIILGDRSTWPPIELWNVEQAIAVLLISGDVIPLNNSGMIGLYASCSDIFFWGAADGEALPLVGFGDEDDAKVLSLYNMCRESVHGVARWCCIQRGMRPQKPYEKQMRDEGAWTPDLEELPVRVRQRPPGPDSEVKPKRLED